MARFNVASYSNSKIIIVDDELSIADFVNETLTNNGYEVSAFTDPVSALHDIKRNQFDLALFDINMPKLDGVELSRKIKEISPQTEVLIITGVPDEKNLDPCLQMGITHFLFKPFNESQLVYTVYAALHFKRLRSVYLSSNTSKIKGSGLVGISKTTRDIREEIMSVADIELPVLILGKSGTGKEVIARDIHRNSSRNQGPFIPINSAVLGALAESELFGHAKGAFTGASHKTKGYIGAANGGTLFFDEIGELQIDIQAKLLRFLDDGEYIKAGEAKLSKSNVRILAATNADLEKMCRSGDFREDLYYRLSGTIIKTTALDDRKADILPLIWHFLDIFGTAQNKTYEISADAASLLVDHDWPGNVRQLKQTLYKITQIAPSRKISPADARRVLGNAKHREMLTYKVAKQQTLEEFDREYLMKALNLAQGRLQVALKLTGMHKKNFYTKLKGIGVTLKDFSTGKM